MKSVKLKNLFYLAAMVAMLGFIILNSRPHMLSEAEIIKALASSRTIADEDKPLPPDSIGAQSIASAAKENKFHFLYIHDGTEAKKDKTAGNFIKLLEDDFAGAAYAFIDRFAEKEKELIARYSLEKVPAPIVVVLAPNGAITAVMPATMVDSNKLNESLVSPVAQKMHYSLQAGKLVILQIFNEKSTNIKEASIGINEFIGQAFIASKSTCLHISPNDESERKFLHKLNVDTSSIEAQTVMIIPPGKIAGIFKGALSSADLMQAMQSAMRPSCSCGSGY